MALLVVPCSVGMQFSIYFYLTKEATEYLLTFNSCKACLFRFLFVEHTCFEGLGGIGAWKLFPQKMIASLAP
jgi:hypothetical protein